MLCGVHRFPKNNNFRCLLLSHHNERGLLMPEATNQKKPRNVNAAKYTAEDIQVLGGREAVRRRPGMYIGSTDQRGLHHLLYEIAYNSVDEAMAGSCDRIIVTLKKDKSVTVEDNGRGIPVDIHY